ncbi:hypothetical protein GF339_02040 [candidate division KSB3 bacterium]|uniref:YggT family protein n=1 Tax=candidate division KSB3 bacterium TaxID=2044937 RepID=A0A9D5JSS4_9BACT|nr:hypothetical protein [candidate division KSB3 bacterium]MBD3323332.1 hypothetical protein [candidate division KSB3 bacterium]
MIVLRNFANIIDMLLQAYLWIVFLAVIFSWFPLSPHDPTAQKIQHFLKRATQPVFNAFRRTFQLQRYTRPIDFTPLLVILTIYFLRIFLVQTLRNMAVVQNFFQAIFYTLHFVLNIYFWIVVIAAIFIILPRFFPQHTLASIRIPFIHRTTEPVFEFFRNLFHSRLQVQVSDLSPPVDLAPFLTLIAIYILQSLLMRVAALFL